MNEQTQAFDVVVIGAGPAGLTAGIYSSWLGLKTLVLEASVVGGRASEAPRIENFPGFEDGIRGSELVAKMSKQASRLGAMIETTEEVVDLDLKGEIKRVITRRKVHSTAVVIIATGTQRKKLQVPGEAELLGRGVSYCTVCDGPLFRNARVAIVGNSEEAVIDALFLAEIAKSVTIVIQDSKLKIEGILKEKLRNKTNVKVIRGNVIGIFGEQVVKSIKILEPDVGRELVQEVNGVFISMGRVPLTEIVRKAGIHTDQNGCHIVDRLQRTNIEGVYAAGDCTCGGMQIVTASGEGAMAAMKAAAYVRKATSSNRPSRSSLGDSRVSLGDKRGRASMMRM